MKLKQKKLKQKKPLNKWKIAAIISIAVNFLVAVLLVIGLTQPKTEKTSALGTGGDYYIYENSNNINPSELSYYDYNTLSWTDNYYDSNNDRYVCVRYTHEPLIASDYVDTSLFVDFVAIYFSRVDIYDEHGHTIDYWLDEIDLTPYGELNSWRNVYHCTIGSNGSISNVSYRSLGIDSPYIFLPIVELGNTTLLLDKVFINKGTNEVITDYDIRENWSPNKYISLVTDSVGLLYDSPSAISGTTIGSVKGVSWSNPIYRGDNKSQLGYLEIPLLFTSHGENFIGIRLYYDVVMNYVDKNNEIQTFSYGSSANLHDFHYTFVYMSYVYELSNSLGSAKYSWKEKVVCALPIYRSLTSYIEDDIWVRNFVYEVYQPYNWLHEDYKSIGVYEASTPYLNRVGFSEPMNTRSLAINNMTIREILEFDMTQNDYGINTNGYVSIGNVFVLIGSAFSSVMPLLSVVIVPGITIGMLLFIPLVLTIIIVVIKLVKR